MGALYFGDKVDVVRGEIKERHQNFVILSGVHNFKRAKKESKKVKQETLKGF